MNTTIYRDSSYVDRISNRLNRGLSLGKLLDLKPNRLPREKDYSTYISIVKSLEEVYPGKWDIQFILAPHFEQYNNLYGHNATLSGEVFNGIKVRDIIVTIHFDEFTISNNLEQSRTIKDLFFRFNVTLVNEYYPFQESHFEVSGLRVTRSTLSGVEYQSGYVHSHTPGRAVFAPPSSYADFNKLCLGSGELSILKTLLKPDYDEDLFKLFLYQIQNYVIWESLDGGPYRKMSEIGSRSREYMSMSKFLSFNSSNWYTLYEYLRHNLTKTVSLEEFSDSIKWHINKESKTLFSNTATPDFNRILKEVLYDNFKAYFVFVENVSKRPFTINNSAVELSIEEVHQINAQNIELFKFRKQPVIFKIIDVDSIIKSENYTIEIYPKIKEYVLSEFSKDYYLQAIKESGFRRLSKSKSARNFFKQDEVLV